MACAPGDWACQLGGVASGWLASSTGQAVKALADSIADGVGQMVKELGTFWIDVPTPDLTDGSGGSVKAFQDGGLATVLSWTAWIGLVVCVLSLIAVGAMLAVGRKRGQAIGRLGLVLLGAALVGGAGSLIGWLLPRQPSSEASAAVGFVQGSTWYLVGVLAIASVLIAGIRMAWEQRARPGADLVRSLLTLVIVSGAGLAFLGVLIAAADAFSSWIVQQSTTGKDFGTNLSGMLALTSTTPILVIVLGIVALLGAILQIGLIVLRSAMLVLLAGVLPLTASFTNTSTGRTWFQKTVAWTLAFVLYKPAAAIVYATAFRLVESDAFKTGPDGVLNVIAGVVLMGAALLALPALMRFLAPAVSAISTGGVGVMEAGGAVASGAVGIQNARAMFSSQSGGSGGGSAPTGASSAGAAKSAGASGGAGTASAAGSGGASAGAAAGGSAAGGAVAAAGPVGVGIAAGAAVAGKAAEGAKSMADQVKKHTEGGGIE
jgi:hypothetical protein